MCLAGRDDCENSNNVHSPFKQDQYWPRTWLKGGVPDLWERGWSDERTDRQTDAGTDGWGDGRTDGRTDKLGIEPVQPSWGLGLG